MQRSSTALFSSSESLLLLRFSLTIPAAQASAGKMRGSMSIALSLACLFGGGILLSSAVENPEEYVNPLGGTSSRYDMSHGNTLPLIARPWGFNSWSPYTDKDAGSWFFHPNDYRFFGVRCTHQPSPWINDYGQFTVNAIMVDPSHDDVDQYSSYDPKKSVFSPYYFRAEQLAYSTSVETTSIEFTSSNHGALMQISYPKYDGDSDFNQTRRILVRLNGGGDNSEVSTSEDGGIVIKGVSKANSGGIASQGTFGHHFVIGLYSNNDKPITELMASKSSSEAAWVDLSAKDPANQRILLRIGTSFISSEQALLNMEQEVGSPLMLEDIIAESKQEWRETLNRVDVKEVGDGFSDMEKHDLLTTFYSSLYRASLFPRQLSETNSEGISVHWSPYADDGQIFEGPLSSDSGFWDAYSTVYPLLTLVNVDRLSLTIQGWLNAYKEGGWLPKWASPGYRGSMVGTMGDVSLADAIVKGIAGFDHDLAYEAIRKDAFEQPEEGSEGGRECLTTYIRHGFIPHNSPSDTNAGTCSEVVSRSLDYYQADFAISQAAYRLGRDSDASALYQRWSNYSQLFDAETGMIRSRRLATGEFTEPFDQYAWGGDYTEAGPWQYRFSIPYDPKGLSLLYSTGGLDMCDKLEEMQTTQPTYHLGSYGSQIHEMTEMAVNCWGQYEHNNQPVHHVLYMFGAIGDAKCTSRGQYYLRKALSELYSPGEDMFAGDEDNGEMGAWYVLSALGLYSLSPGTENYVLGSPLFASVKINLSSTVSNVEEGRHLFIESKNNSMENVYVQEVQWNGESLSSGVNSIKYSTLMKGGTLSFLMGPSPP